MFDSEEVSGSAGNAIADGVYDRADVFYAFAVEQTEGPDCGAKNWGRESDFGCGR